MPYPRELDDSALSAAAAAVEPLARRLGLSEDLARYAPFRFQAHDGRPTLHLDDLSGIPFLDGVAGIEEYQHRARVRCGEGDVFASVTPPIEGYEAYCRDVLGLGAPEFVQAEPVGAPLYVAAACRAEPAFSALCDKARDGLVLHPYMAMEALWELGAALHEATGAPISVLGPPPPVTWVANDKALFDELVHAVVGRDMLVDTARVSDSTALADALWTLAQRHDRVGLKRTRCASAMGNEVHESQALRHLGKVGVEALVDAFLHRTRWEGDEELLAVAWEDTELSPSTQLWIPPAGQGSPRLDGIYEQILEGPEKVFLGSRPSQLGEALETRIADAALRVAAGLQALGYVGRCSFDHLVVGERVLFTECNGRWGGTSTPMSLLDRLFDERPPYRAQDVMHPSLKGRPFPEITAALGDDLWSPSNPRGRFVLYNTGPLRTAGKLDVISLADNQDEAERGMLEVLPARLGFA
ncbi:MAG: hypothetical protein EP329_15900 [Deltaproteobacteria bacterium]|nr:MAG: hypothetical protein EP329_15900 [Deltaproteobacteria bacterium]